jgi:hypothetical protein
MEVRKSPKNNIWLPTRTNNKNLVNLGHFFHGEIPHIDRNHIFQVRIWQNSPVKETLLGHIRNMNMIK